LFVWVTFAGATFSMAGMITAVWFVKCPECALRLVPWSMRSQPHSKWLAWLLLFERCPRCGYTPCEEEPKNGET
jgi:hypothetical protein